MDRYIELSEAQGQLDALVGRLGQGVVLTRNGKPVARLAPIEATAAADATATPMGVRLAPEFEPSDARLARLAQDSQVPYRLRELPRN